VKEPTIYQLVLLVASAAMFAVGGLLSLLRLRKESERLRVGAKACMYAGVCAALGVIIWHSNSRGAWSPLRDNFEALIWLGVILALFVMYLQRHRPVPGLDWFVMPIVIMLLLGAAIFGRVEYQQYQPLVGHTWEWVHRVSSYTGTIAFAIGAAGGAMYMYTSKRLRKKEIRGPKMASLERLEKLMMRAVVLGFALLTVGLVTGFVRMVDSGRETPYSKMLLASGAWLVYAIVMHAPINPRFRGRRAAVLSMLGFGLIIGTIIAVEFMPLGGGAR
jgi:ABC-type uncharacterized transport system permease subunit